MIEIGKLQMFGSEGSRDAVHVPIVCARNVSGKSVAGGKFVRFVDDRFTQFVESNKRNYHGIVDPFIGGVIIDGATVAIFLKPGTVTKLIHYFEPSFTDLPHYEEPKPEPEPSYDDDEYDSCRGCY